MLSEQLRNAIDSAAGEESDRSVAERLTAAGLRVSREAVRRHRRAIEARRFPCDGWISWDARRDFRAKLRELGFEPHGPE